MRFLDELRGSEGERCTVTDLRRGEQWDGTILAVHFDRGKVDVRRDDGVAYEVGYSFVQLHGKEA